MYEAEMLSCMLGFCDFGYIFLKNISRKLFWTVMSWQDLRCMRPLRGGCLQGIKEIRTQNTPGMEVFCLNLYPIYSSSASAGSASMRAFLFSVCFIIIVRVVKQMTNVITVVMRAAAMVPTGF